MERLTDTCVVTEFGRDGLDSHNCSHFCPNTPNSSWQKFALLANPVSDDKLSLYLMQKNGKTSNLNATKLALHPNLTYFNAFVLTLANQRISLGWSSTALLLC